MLEDYRTYEIEANWTSIEQLRALRWLDVQRVLDFYEEDPQYPLFETEPINTTR